MEKMLSFLQQIHPFSDGLLDYLDGHVKSREISRKDYLLRAGHISRAIHFVESGLLRCYYLKGDAEVSSWFMKADDLIISIESFHLQKPSYESIQALEDSFLYYIDYAELEYIYKNFSEFNFVARVLTQKYHVLWAQQLYGLRMQTPEQRYEWLLSNHSELLLQVPSKYLASYLGIGEVTLSRIKGRRRFLIPR